MASSSDLKIVVDVVVPVVFVVGLFIINGFVLRFIMRKRREYQNLPQLEATAEEPTTSAAATARAPALQVPVAMAENDDSCSIEMERL